MATRLSNRALSLSLSVAAFGLIAPVAASAATIIPLYDPIATLDATTNQNQTEKTDGKFGWFIDPGADDYGNDPSTGGEVYERPVTQSFEQMNADAGGTFIGAKQYQSNLDIARAFSGFDDKYLYVGVDMVGLDKVTEDGTLTAEGLKYRYMFLMGSESDGANGYMFFVNDPANSHSPNTTFSPLKTEGFWDTDGDVGGVGGLFVTKDEGDTVIDGYDLKIIGDGKLLSGPNIDLEVLFARIDPSDSTMVEFALEYGRLGLDSSDILGLQFFDVRAIDGGLKDPQNFLWNDKETFATSGTPYTTQGLNNVYLSDNLRLGAPGGPGGGIPGPIPEPTTWAMMILGFGLIGILLRGERRRRSVRHVFTLAVPASTQACGASFESRRARAAWSAT